MLDGYAVLLDKKQIKTPEGQPIRIPPANKTLAYLVAGEWESQREALRTHSLPLTSMICRAQESLIKSEEREKVIESLLAYFRTDSVCLHESHPDILVEMQEKYWQPLIRWAESEFGIKVVTADNIFIMRQPQESVDKLREVARGFSPLELAAFEKAVMTSKSFLIGLAIVKRHMSSKDAAIAARVEALSQIKYWGELVNAHDLDEAEMNKYLGAAACLVISI
ncbi:chaperone [Spiromyces aspiralis]|uniref:Chaperone n=1 Tax=Spiromyces aspiralis TaxID=68401 RepID=A0ACC1HAZ3_9FUNG|nr:chaperone [Spiromyces aspiralis]